MKIRYFVFVPYLIFIGVMDGNIMAESIVIGICLGTYDLLFGNGGGGRPA